MPWICVIKKRVSFGQQKCIFRQIMNGMAELIRKLKGENSLRMKKKILAVLMMAAAVMTFAACGNKEADKSEAPETDAKTEEAAAQNGETAEGEVYLKDIKAADYITLGNYKGIEVTLADPEVTDDYLEGYIEYVRQNSPVSIPVTDRAAKEGDVVNVDFEGKLDGVAFDGGSAQGTDITIGAGGFIPGFEDGIIGMKTGETKDVEVTFPDPYQNNPDLAGKPAVFTITVNSISIQEIPELTDEYVAGLNLEGCSTVEDYKVYVKELLLEQEKTNYESEKTNAVMSIIEEGTEFKDAPAGMVNRMNETLTNNINAYAGMYGMDIGTYVANAYGGEAENYEQTLLEQAQFMSQRYIMMQAIADKENLTVSDEDVDAQMAAEAESYGYENAEEYKKAVDVEAYREYLMTQKVLSFLSDNAVVKKAETADTQETASGETDKAAEEEEAEQETAE